MRVLAFLGQGDIVGLTPHATARNLPAEGRPWKRWKTIDLELPVVGIDPIRARADIAERGYHLTKASQRR